MNSSKEHIESYINEVEAIEEALKKRREENGILYYVPNYKQYKFHCSMSKRVLFVAGNRTGKSEAAVAELVFHSTGYYPDWGVHKGVHYKYPDAKKRLGPQKILWISPIFDHLIKFIEPKIMKLMPKGAIVGKPKRASDSYLLHMEVRHATGGISKIDFQSQEQKNKMAFEGADYDIVIADEPLKRWIYTAVSRGLMDRGGVMFFPFTPLEEQWIKEELCDKADGKFVDLITAETRDNLFDIKGNPILNEQFIKEYEKTLSEDEKEIRLKGRWYHMSGMVYKEFDLPTHVIPDRPVPKDAAIFYALDPHDRNPHWGIWAYVDKTGDVVVCNELIAHGTPEEYVKRALDLERSLGYRVRKRIIDPNFGNKPKSVGSSVRVIDQFRSCGFKNLVLGIDDEEAGKMKIRSMLKFDKSKPVGISNRPKLYFFKDGARETRGAFQNLQYEDWTKSSADSKELREKVRDKNKHASDCIRYLLMSNPKFEQVGEQEELDKPIY